MTDEPTDLDDILRELGDELEDLGVWPDEQAAWLLDAPWLHEDIDLDPRIWPTLAAAGEQERVGRLAAGFRALRADGSVHVDEDGWYAQGLAAVVWGVAVEAEHVAGAAVLRADDDGPLPTVLLRLVRAGDQTVLLIQDVDVDDGQHHLLLARPWSALDALVAAVVDPMGDGAEEEPSASGDTSTDAAAQRTAGLEADGYAAALEAAGALHMQVRLELHHGPEPEAGVVLTNLALTVDGRWLVGVPADDGTITLLTGGRRDAGAVVTTLLQRWIGRFVADDGTPVG
ncbi:MAG: hypothetical protein JJT89_01965 [Nitriliruptoraceae bacterium]|nr:hypothetical protein [Nitriliruptoraceae bacterium]